MLYVVRYTHKNGSTVWIRCRGIAIRDENGKAIRMLGAHQDISDIKNSEQELIIAKEKAEQSEAKLNNGVVHQLNPDTRDTYISNGVKFSGNGNDGILQEVKGLEPNTAKVVAGWLKTGDAAGIRIGIRDHGGNEFYETATGQNWSVIEFTTGPENRYATIFIQKTKRKGFCRQYRTVACFFMAETESQIRSDRTP